MTSKGDSKVEKAYKKTQNIYDGILTGTTWWGKLYLNMFWGGINSRDIANAVLDRIPNDAEQKILEVPVGTGIFTCQKYALMSKSEIVCLDYSMDMLQQAIDRGESMGLENTKFIQGDVGNLPYPDESFDMVISLNGFHVFPAKEKAYDEVYRVLKKDGILLGSFYIKNQNKISDFLVNKVLAKKGWFTPPFETLESLTHRLQHAYTECTIENVGAEVWFECKK